MKNLGSDYLHEIATNIFLLNNNMLMLSFDFEQKRSS